MLTNFTTSYKRSRSNDDSHDKRRISLRKIAESTLEAISNNRYVHDGTSYPLSITEAKQRVLYFAPGSLLSSWRSAPSLLAPAPLTKTEISFLEISTLDGAKLLRNTIPADHRDPKSMAKIGVLNFASAKKPGGGFINGAQAQEESIARSSTLYSTLTTSTAQQFYTLHKHDPKDGFYTHAMLFSPGVTVFRDDSGAWTVPLDIDVVTSAAVNAGTVRSSLKSLASKDTEDRITRVMKERMARILHLFEKENIRNLVLGSFGTGVFKNSVPSVAEIWADLLAAEGSRFQNSFDRVVFAILGSKTFNDFKSSFETHLIAEAGSS